MPSPSFATLLQHAWQAWHSASLQACAGQVGRAAHASAALFPLHAGQEMACRPATGCAALSAVHVVVNQRCASAWLLCPLPAAAPVAAPRATPPLPQPAGGLAGAAGPRRLTSKGRQLAGRPGRTARGAGQTGPPWPARPRGCGSRPPPQRAPSVGHPCMLQAQGNEGTCSNLVRRSLARRGKAVPDGWRAQPCLRSTCLPGLRSGLSLPGSSRREAA